MSRPVALECESLSKHYGGLLAVQDVSFRVYVGETLGLVGPNGAGKSTVIDLITGVQRADRGRVVVDGRVLKGSPSHRANAGGLGRTFQHPQLSPDLTVYENMLVNVTARQLHSPAGQIRSLLRGLLRPTYGQAEPEVRRVAADVGVNDVGRLCSDLDLGSMRVVEFARALAQRPKVLLLDEPFVGSDAATLEHVTAALTRVREAGCGVILVDHNVDLVASIVDRIVLMSGGRVVFDGDPAECLASDEMRRVYFGSRRAHT
ncbi:MAG: ATP-binding cassette domain-containing protein [Gaiella sp.]|nr:ATP-binding cassette domain-containing protein [Gaiella sp.]